MIQKKTNEFAVEIRGKDREQIFQQKRLRRKFECEIDEAQLQQENYQLRNLWLLADLFMDPLVSLTEQAQLLLAAIQFTENDENSHSAIKLLIQKEGLVEKLKESIYDENLPLKFRELSIQVLGQMLNCTYQLCAILISKGLIKFMITFAKLSFQNKMFEFLIHSLTGIGNLVGHSADVRNQMVEEQVDQLLLNILQSPESQYKTKLYQKVGYILNNWFRDKLPNIPFQLFLDIGELVLQLDIDEEYQDDIVWFFYQFAAQSLDQLKQNQCDEFIYKLLSLEQFHNFLTRRLLDYRSLGCVASVRLMIKMIRFSVVPDFVIAKFQNDLTTIFHKCVNHEINMMKIEALKLANVLISKMPNTPFVKQEFATLLIYFSQSPRTQEYVLNALANCDIHLLDEEQQAQAYQLCQNIIFSQNYDILNKLIFSLKIILNLNLPELSFDVLTKIEDLQYHQSKEVYELSYAIVEKYKK